MELGDIIFPVFLWLAGMAVVFTTPKIVIVNTIGMIMATIGVGLMIPACFQDSETKGWLMVGASVFYLYLSIQAYITYCRLNKLDEED